MEEFAPEPAGAERVCSDMGNGTMQCDYTCTDPNAIVFTSTGPLINTATSICSDSDVGYQPVMDCIGMSRKTVFT